MKIKTLALLLCTLMSTSCISSPLLDHVDAAAGDEVRTLEQKSECPLLFSAQGYCASLVWVTMPSDDQTGAMALRFWQKDSATQSGPYSTPPFDVGVKLWMPSMGHGSTPTTVAAIRNEKGEILPGMFDVTNVHFVMGGAWEIWVQLKQGRTVVSQAKIDVQIQ